MSFQFDAVLDPARFGVFSMGSIFPLGFHRESPRLSSVSFLSRSINSRDSGCRMGPDESDLPRGILLFPLLMDDWIVRPNIFVLVS